MSGTVGVLSQGRRDWLGLMTSGHSKLSILMHLASFGCACHLIGFDYVPRYMRQVICCVQVKVSTHFSKCMNVLSMLACWGMFDENIVLFLLVGKGPKSVSVEGKGGGLISPIVRMLPTSIDDRSGHCAIVRAVIVVFT